jgi:nucleosome binding factor SPN SPT16 subunit
MKDGVPSKDVYQHAIDFVQEKKPELVKNLIKNVGFSVSLHVG